MGSVAGLVRRLIDGGLCRVCVCVDLCCVMMMCVDDVMYKFSFIPTTLGIIDSF